MLSYFALLKRLLWAKPGDYTALDLAPAVEVVISTFAVLVGISLTDFFDDQKNRLPEDVRNWAFWALVALLLRYIIGSAIHLKNAYAVSQLDYRDSPSIGRMLKDILFLVLFGLVAVHMTHSKTIDHFIQQAGVFVAISLLWSISDPFFRKWPFGRIWGPAIGGQKPFWKIWAPIDALQLAFTLLAYRYMRGDPIWAAKALAFAYTGFVAVDLVLMLRLRALR